MIDIPIASDGSGNSSSSSEQEIEQLQGPYEKGDAIMGPQAGQQDEDENEIYMFNRASAIKQTRRIAVNDINITRSKNYSRRPSKMIVDIVDFSDEAVKDSFDQVDAVQNKVANHRAKRKVILPGAQNINYLRLLKKNSF